MRLRLKAASPATAIGMAWKTRHRASGSVFAHSWGDIGLARLGCAQTSRCAVAPCRLPAAICIEAGNGLGRSHVTSR